MKHLFSPALVAGSLLLASAPADAAVISYTFDFGSSYQESMLPGFNEALGTLTDVVVNRRLLVDTSLFAENLSSSSVMVDYLGSFGNVSLASSAFFFEEWFNFDSTPGELGGFDGDEDFAGTSGFSNHQSTGHIERAYHDPDLMEYTGVAEIPFSYSFFYARNYTGPDGGIVNAAAQAEAVTQLQIDYHYTARPDTAYETVPDAASTVALFGFAMIVCVAARRVQRRK